MMPEFSKALRAYSAVVAYGYEGWKLRRSEGGFG